MIIMLISSDCLVSGQTTVALVATAENIFLIPSKYIGTFEILSRGKSINVSI